MRFKITDDGNDNFLLITESGDGSIHGDTWHQTLQEAKQVALQYYGVPLEAWKHVAHRESSAQQTPSA